MKPLQTLFIIASLLLLSCTPQTTVEEIPDHQPANPKTWSPAGKIYVCHDTYENSPAEDKYWALVLNFFTEDSVVKYQTPNRDISYHADYMRLVDSTRYDMDYPNIIYYSLAGGTSNITVIDTATLYWKAIDITYGIIHN